MAMLAGLVAVFPDVDLNGGQCRSVEEGDILAYA
jgi:hypothetical protein